MIGLYRALWEAIDTKFTAWYTIFEFRGNSSVVERDLAKVDVAGPTPVSRLD